MSRREPEHPAVRSRLKRVMDLAIAGTALVTTAPVLLLAAGLVRSSSPGPVLFRQQRAGLHRQPFELLKLRTMTHDPHRVSKAQVELDNPEVTSVGRWLRRFKIDELPQVLNVLNGDMSVVGPRPTLPEQVAQYDETKMKRMSVRPGLTGLAQVNGNASISWDERIRYDLSYVQTWNLGLDLEIILRTFLVLAFGEQSFAYSWCAGNVSQEMTERAEQVQL